MAVAGEALMAKMANGDIVAFEEFLSGYQGAAYRYAYRIFRDKHTAEDVSQEFFFKLFRNAGKYKPAGKFMTNIPPSPRRLFRYEIPARSP